MIRRAPPPGPQSPSPASADNADAPDPRIQASRERVLSTTLELLTETGLGGVSVDEVSRRSGVAKTTIYRHWPNRVALIVDACARIATEEEAPDTGTLAGDLTVILLQIGELLGTARWSSIVPSIVDVAERDSGFADVHSRIQRGHAAPLRTAIGRAEHRGEMSAGADRSALAAALLGPLFYRRWFSREPIDQSFVQLIVSGVVHGLGLSFSSGEADTDL